MSDATARLPETMKAVEISEPGDAGVLRLVERPVPQPGEGQMLVRVAAIGVNRADIVQRMGFYPAPPGASDLPGLEVSGTVVALGAGVEAWSVGDRVCSILAGGGYAEYAVLDAPVALPVPANLTLTEGAALAETIMTVWTNVFERCRLQPGERFLVHGGTSGIGVSAIQMARAHGVEVFTTAGSAEKCKVCEDLGAARAINYREEDFVEVVKEATGGKGVDVILDMVGGDYVERNIKALAVEGRMVNIAYMKGSKVEVNLMPVMLKRLSIMGSTLRARPVADKAAITASVRAHIWPLVENGTIRTIVDQTFPLAEAAKAHERMESSAHIGKIVLTTQ